MIQLIAGGYAAAGARGLYPLALNHQTLSVGEPLAQYVNVSAGLRLPGSQRWFLVDECAGTLSLADAAGGWRSLASIPAGGEEPCHLALHPDAQRLAVAHYGSGTVAVFGLAKSGATVGDPVLHRLQGSGPVPGRQDGPHAHWVGFGPDDRLYVTDLGSDRVLAFVADATNETVEPPRIAFAAPPGSGPRRFVFHPVHPLAYLISELASTLTVLRLAGDGGMVATQSLSTLPQGACESLGGAIVLNDEATRLYVTNRGHDSIASFALAPSGAATLLGHTPSGGSSPRFLLLLGRRLLVAHEKTGGVTLLALDADGRPHLTDVRAEVPGAAFLGVTLSL